MNISKNLNNYGTLGIFLTAILSPCCFPLFAFAASALGLGTFELFGAWTMWIFQGLVLISIIGLFFSYRKHKCMYPLLLAIPCGILIFYSYHFIRADYWTYLMYTGMFGILIATIWDYRQIKLHGHCSTCVQYKDTWVELSSTITCPHCGYKKEEKMPTDSCVYFYECQHCKTQLKPLKGDCCVYCSYATVKCPPIQAGDKCC